MSRKVAVLLETSRLRALLPGEGDSLLDVAWDQSAPQAGVRRLREALAANRAPTSLVLVVGLGALEIARPELPPIGEESQRTLLLRDADRYFPIEGAIAVAWADPFAFALPERSFALWIREFESVAPVESVLALPQALARAGQRGTFEVAAGANERGIITVDDGLLQDVRRVASDSTTAQNAPAGTHSGTAHEIDVAAVLRAAVSAQPVPIAQQLLDRAHADRLVGTRRLRLWRSVALLCAAVTTLVWSADRRRERTLDRAQQEVALLRVAAAPGQRAALRLERARTEQQLLASADSINDSDNTPAAILARLGALLPKDAFVQRLDFDGTVWRIDGSATDAPRIVPLLDADAHFADVRIAAASTRFMDAGKQRESFSIVFRTKSPAAGGRNGR